MTHKKIYEEHRTLDRAELAERLRGLAEELDGGGVITYGSDGTAGTLALPEKLRGKVEITHSGHDGHVKIVARLRFADLDSETAATHTIQPDPADADDAEWEADDPYA